MPTTNFNWRNSKPHMQLLNKFLRPCSIEEFFKDNYWDNLLGESAKQAIKHFFDEGALIQPTLFEQIDLKFKADDLKRLLKERGLPVSGKKADLINKLIQFDTNGAKEYVKEEKLLVCSEQGKVIAEKYLADILEKKNKCDNLVLECLKQRKFREACMAVATYEYEQGLSGDRFTTYDPTDDVVALNAIFSYKLPPLWQSIGGDLEELRLAAGMDFLWGTKNAKWLPLLPDTDMAKRRSAVWLFLHNGYYHRAMWGYRKTSVVPHVAVLAGECCDNCKKLAGIKFTLDKIPELPYKECTREQGCNCVVMPLPTGSADNLLAASIGKKS
jgi:hypothetical protein